MDTFDWNTATHDEVTPGYQRRIALVSDMSVARITGEAGEVTRPHSHEAEEFVLVISGAWRFVLEGREVTLRAGQGLFIPGGVEHASEMLEPTVALDICTPARVDWLSGEDRYLHTNPDDFLWAV